MRTWRRIYGESGTDTWVMESTDGRYVLIQDCIYEGKKKTKKIKLIVLNNSDKTVMFS